MKSGLHFLPIDNLPDDCRRAILEDEIIRNNVVDGVYSCAVHVAGGCALVGLDSENRILGVKVLTAGLTEQQVWDYVANA